MLFLRTFSVESGGRKIDVDTKTTVIDICLFEHKEGEVRLNYERNTETNFMTNKNAYKVI